MADIANQAYGVKRERSRSPRRRSRSPRAARRSFSPRSRSRSRDGYRRTERRSRSPKQESAAGASGGYSNRAQGARSSEPKQEMQSTLRENSQQDRRVYVGNLSYDVKWHHLKDFMRQGS